jgi:hypothetical protein
MEKNKVRNIGLCAIVGLLAIVGTSYLTKLNYKRELTKKHYEKRRELERVLEKNYDSNNDRVLSASELRIMFDDAGFRDTINSGTVFYIGEGKYILWEGRNHVHIPLETACELIGGNVGGRYHELMKRGK